MKIQLCIATEGGGSNNLCDPNLSSFPDTYYNVSICPFCYSSCTWKVIKCLQCNIQSQQDAEIWPSTREILGDTEWMFYTCDYSFIWCGDYICKAPILSWYFRSKHVNIISMIKYNSSIVYYWFSNPFQVVFVSQALNIPPVSIDDIPRRIKRSRYTFD